MRNAVLAGVVAAAALALGGTAAAGRVPRFPAIPGVWSHAEINVTVGKTPHTLILDRGRIVRVAAGELWLRERDATVVTMPLTPQTRVTIGRRRGTVASLHRRMAVETMRIDGGPAVRVRRR